MLLLLTSSQIKPLTAQNALSFDGVDDYVELQATRPFGLFQENGFTVEFILKFSSISNSQVLLSHFNGNSEFQLGINENGVPYFFDAGESVFWEDIQIDEEGCNHLSFVFEGEIVQLYVNGEEAGTIQTSGNLSLLDSYKPFYLGTDINQGSFFHGIMEDFRIFFGAKQQPEIQNYLFTSLPIHAMLVYMYFDFDNFLPTNVTYDPYNHSNLGYLGGAGLTSYKQPFATDGVCVEFPHDLPESVNPVCQLQGPCVPNSPVPGDLICNGSFEQYCNLLNYSVTPNQRHWMSAWHAFTHWSPNLGANGFLGSDVVNWQNYFPNPSNINSMGFPSFFVRDGIGTNANVGGFSPDWGIRDPLFTFSPMFVNPPTETWNGISNAAAGLHSIAHSDANNNPRGEALFTLLQQAIVPQQQYTFSGRFYATQMFALNQLPHYQDGTLEVAVRNSNTGVEIIVGSVTIPSWHNVSDNNHWFFGTLNFVLEPTRTGFDELIIHNPYDNVTPTYIFVDDLSLVETPETSFPQYINSGNESDAFNRRVEVDENDNVYVMGTVANGATPTQIVIGTPPNTQIHTAAPNELGTYFVKYSPTGNRLWSNYLPHVKMANFKIMPNGNLFAVGETQTAGAGGWGNINYVNQSTTPFFPNCINGAFGYTHRSSISLVTATLNFTNGFVVGTIDAYGSEGKEYAKDVWIIGNSAYIAAEIEENHVCNLSFTGGIDWGTPNVTVINRRILVYDLTNNSPSGVAPNSHTSKYRRLSAFGNFLVVLTDDRLEALNTANNFSLHRGRNISNAINGVTYFTNYMHVDVGGNIYLQYPSSHGNANILEQYDINLPNFPLVNTATYQDVVLSNGSMVRRSFVGITGFSDIVYTSSILENISSTGIVNSVDFEVARLSLDPGQTFGDFMWSHKSTSSGNALFTNINLHDAFWTMFDIQAFPDKPNVAAIGQFASNGAWTLDFPPKQLSGNTVPYNYNNTFVATIMDLYAGAIYYKNDTSTIDGLSEIQLFPNPATSEIKVTNIATYTSLNCMSVTGQHVFRQQLSGESSVLLNVQQLSSGVYLLVVESEKEIKTLRFVKN